MAVWFYLKNQFFADKGFKLLTFDELFSPYIKNKRAIGLPQHIVNFIDSNVAVLGGFFECQCDLEVNWNGVYWVAH